MPKMLSEKHEMAALLDAQGATGVEIAEKVGFHPKYVSILRGKVEYQLLVTKFKREIQERVIDQSATLLNYFNDEALPAARTLVAVHKNDAEKGSARVSAATAILDYSSIAPRRKGIDAGQTVVVNLGVKTVTNMQTALADIGDAETLELLEDEHEAIESIIVAKEA